MDAGSALRALLKSGHDRTHEASTQPAAVAAAGVTASSGASSAISPSRSSKSQLVKSPDEPIDVEFLLSDSDPGSPTPATYGQQARSFGSDSTHLLGASHSPAETVHCDALQPLSGIAASRAGDDFPLGAPCALSPMLAQAEVIRVMHVALLTVIRLCLQLHAFLRGCFMAHQKTTILAQAEVMQPNSNLRLLCHGWHFMKACKLKKVAQSAVIALPSERRLICHTEHFSAHYKRRSTGVPLPAPLLSKLAQGLSCLQLHHNLLQKQGVLPSPRWHKSQRLRCHALSRGCMPFRQTSGSSSCAVSHHMLHVLCSQKQLLLRLPPGFRVPQTDLQQTFEGMHR